MHQVVVTLPGTHPVVRQFVPKSQEIVSCLAQPCPSIIVTGHCMPRS